MSTTDANSSRIKAFFDNLGSVDRDLLCEVLVDTVEASSENSTKPLRYISHQLRREIDRERRKIDALRGQLQSVDRLLSKLRPIETGEDSSEILSLMTVLQSRSEDLNTRIGESPLFEKEARLVKLQRTLSGVQVRARVSQSILHEMISEDTEST
jgi:hypothetical protein